eukprot:68117-Alexandrium_andersonii.AAC.1
MSSKQLSETYPTDAIKVVLRDYFLFTASSSGVGQNFTQGMWAFGERQGSAAAGVEEEALM